MAKDSTPMMKQYRQIKSELADDTILFFRLGDFYEMFYEDAEKAAPVLNISLTKRNKMPMCGIPYHSSEQYLAKLIKAGMKVAICEQVEDPSQTKGIVRRAIKQVITPGTVTTESILQSDQSNYLAGLFVDEDITGLALLELSTGAFWVEECRNADAVLDNLSRYQPQECAVAEEQYEIEPIATVRANMPGLILTQCSDWTFEYDAAYDTLTRHLKVHSLEGYGCEGRGAAVGAAGGMMYYVREQLHRDMGHVKSLRLTNPQSFMIVDKATALNLDLVDSRSQISAADGNVTLLKVLDETQTAMGARQLKDWILRPLAELEAVRARHDSVAELMGDRGLLNGIRDELKQVRDLERIIARLSAGGGNARDLRSISQSLGRIPALKQVLSAANSALLKEMDAGISDFPDVVASIERAIDDEPPANLKDGGLIREGYDAELDEIRVIAREGRQWLAEYQASEQTRTGIKNLKVRHNKVHGYYIEISKGQVDNAPEEYVRKQTLVNAERFITPELKEYETKIVGAHDRAVTMEYDMFLEIRDRVVDRTAEIQRAAECIAVVDILGAFADRSLSLRYIRPEMTDGDEMSIVDGRHPVVEQMPDAERFVPNDTELDCAGNQLIILTGPNMAGKSTYIRQVAVIAIMAQMGCFVPASEATIGMIDRVFTRVGASDDLAHGRSTFMVEMQETANILNNASPRSLIILDEIGRGTSTFDGISIAWAVAEYLHDNSSVKAKTLFATHYHELTELSLTMAGVRNYSVLVKEKGESIVFLRKIVPGGADKSYGIQVARLAGLPPDVIARANEILKNLEDGELSDAGQPKIARKRPGKSQADDNQLSLFG